MMIEALLGVPIGALAALLYFGGLRWTVDQVADAGRPVGLLALSFVVRATLLLTITACVIHWSLLALAGAAVGFASSRWWMVGRVRRSLTWS